MSSQPTSSLQVPFRQIRAVYDDETITVYQAYSASIALAAVKEQRLDASADFLLGSRMTWIKPSWCWMMYRSGYATKDARQTHILAIKMRHADFRALLMGAAVCGSTALSADEARRPVRVQWDPERSARIGMLAYRSIQIGIGREAMVRWVESGIVSIEDVTERAAAMREAVKNGVGDGELRDRGWLPVERVYEVSEELSRVLKMDVTGE